MKLGIVMLIIGLISIGFGFGIWIDLTNYPFGEALTAWMTLVGGLWGLGVGLSIGGIVRMIIKK